MYTVTPACENRTRARPRDAENDGRMKRAAYGSSLSEHEHASALSDGLHWSRALLAVGTMAAVGSMQQKPIPKCEIGPCHTSPSALRQAPAGAYSASKTPSLETAAAFCH